VAGDGMKARACDQCKERPAEWALQYVASDTPTFSTLGSHYRGFPIVARLCEKCKDAMQKGQMPQLPDEHDAINGTRYVLKEYP